MGNFIISAAVVTPSAVVKDTENAAYPATNVTDYAHPNVPWRATTLTSGTTYIGLDYGAATALVAVVIDNINVTSVKIDSSADGASWTNRYTVAVSLDVTDGRYKAYQALTSWNYRYLRVLLNVSSTIDGTAVMSCGSVVGLSAVTTLTENTSGTYDRTPLKAVARNDDFAGGGRNPIALGARYCQITISGPVQHYTSAVEMDLFTILGTYGEELVWCFYHNLSSTAEVYWVHRVGTATISQPGPAHLLLSSVVLEEVP